jgi:hypothetical protein
MSTRVMSELTGGVDMMGLLVFQIDESYGRYIDPDQQGVIRVLARSKNSRPVGFLL